MSLLVYPPHHHHHHQTDLLLGKFIKGMVRKKGVEVALRRLDRLTEDMARMAAAEFLLIARRLDYIVKAGYDIAEVANSRLQGVPDSSQQSGIKKVHESHESLSSLYSDLGPISAATPRPLLALTSTAQQVLPEDFKFRILVVGKRGSGKSSLIKAVFNVDVPAAPERRALGKTDINFGYCPEDNRYLIVHECSGLDRAGDSQNFLEIRDFVLHRTDKSRPASERLHAVWICVPASDAIDGNLGEGVEEILRMRTAPT
ncbi:hypothetical protein EI94DRAFT_1791868 [Lactarius quietus]|nr:hypothetical protein EI94DRAFT_1791868 [Lactarius quietus]